MTEKIYREPILTFAHNLEYDDIGRELKVGEDEWEEITTITFKKDGTVSVKCGSATHNLDPDDDITIRWVDEVKPGQPQ